MLKWLNGLVVGLLCGITGGILFMEFAKIAIEKPKERPRPRYYYSYGDYYKKYGQEKEDKE